MVYKIKKTYFFCGLLFFLLLFFLRFSYPENVYADQNACAQILVQGNPVPDKFDDNTQSVVYYFYFSDPNIQHTEKFAVVADDGTGHGLFGLDGFDYVSRADPALQPGNPDNPNSLYLFKGGILRRDNRPQFTNGNHRIRIYRLNQHPRYLNSGQDPSQPVNISNLDLDNSYCQLTYTVTQIPVIFRPPPITCNIEIPNATLNTAMDVTIQHLTIPHLLSDLQTGGLPNHIVLLVKDNTNNTIFSAKPLSNAGPPSLTSDGNSYYDDFKYNLGTPFTAAGNYLINVAWISDLGEVDTCVASRACNFSEDKIFGQCPKIIHIDNNSTTIIPSPTLTPTPTVIPSPTQTVLCNRCIAEKLGCSGSCFYCSFCAGGISSPTPIQPTKSPPAQLKDLCKKAAGGIVTDNGTNLEAKCLACIDNPDESKKGIWTAIGCLPTDLGAFVNKYLFTTGIGIIGGVAFLYLLYGAFLIMTSAGNPEQVAQAQEIITSSLMGLLLAIFSLLILRIISIDILKLPEFGPTR